MGLLLLGGTGIEAAEISGKVFTYVEAEPLAGVKIKLLQRKDSTYTEADGTYRLVFSETSIRGEGSKGGMAGPVLKGNELGFWTPTATREVRLEVYSLAGRRISDRIHQVGVPGEQRLQLGGVLQGLHGIGWLRLTVEKDIHYIRILDMGTAGRRLEGRQARSGPAEKRTEAFAALDTILVENPGYVSKKEQLYPLDGKSRNFALWKNSLFGLDSAEIEAWKSHLLKPVQLIRISRNKVSLPADRTGGAIVTADGKEVESWETGRCSPEAPPKSLHLAYEKDGLSYKDTVPLEGYWRLIDSYRSRRDSLTQYQARVSLTWDWPMATSAVSDRDWMEIRLSNSMTEDHLISYPDVFQVGIRIGIEGGLTRYGMFAPKSGSVVANSVNPGWAAFQAQFNLARRNGHDLRLQIDVASLPVEPGTMEFTNSWPADGRFRADEALQLQGSANPANVDATLEIVMGSFPDWVWPTEGHWDGTRRPWTFPFPVKDPSTFKIRIRENGFSDCPALDESPLLQVLPDPADSAVTAFEPNDGPTTAALVPRGEWISAALDFRDPVSGLADTDYYKFKAAQGEKVRFTIRNPNPLGLGFNPHFIEGDNSSTVILDSEESITHTIPKSGDSQFSINQAWEVGARYSFRIDTVE